MKIRIKFTKQGAMKFIGHLDMMRYFQKVMRRAGVDIRYSEGFSPHQVMSFAAPLGVGLTSSGEYMDIEVHSTEDSKTMLSKINAANAEEVQVISFRRLPDTAVNAMSLVTAADYLVWFREQEAPEDERSFWEDFLQFTQKEQIPIIKKTKKGEKSMDLKPYIYEARSCSLPLNILTDNCQGAAASSDQPAVFLKLSAGSAANIKPELLLAAYYESVNRTCPAFGFQIHRNEVYGGESGAFTALEEYGEDIE